jgi:hypothetical protein
VKTRWAAAIRKCGGHFLFHPADSMLQACRDEASDSAAAETVSRHLRECPACRNRETEQAEALRWFEVHDHAAGEWGAQAAAEAWTPLEQSIDSFALKRSADGVREAGVTPAPGRLSEEALSELRYYLGKRIVKDLISQMPDSSNDIRLLLRQAEPLLTTFLGQKSAAQICFRVSLAGAGK